MISFRYKNRIYTIQTDGHIYFGIAQIPKPSAGLRQAADVALSKENVVLLEEYR